MKPGDLALQAGFTGKKTLGWQGGQAGVQHIQVGTLLLTRQGFGTDAPRVTITRVEDDEGVYDEWPSGAVAEIPLAPGRYRVAGDHEGRQGSTEIEVESEERLEATLSVAE